MRPARDTLARRGIDLGHKRTLDLVNDVAGRAVEQRHRWFDDVRQSALASRAPLAGRRIVVGTDGGRCRMRVPARCGRRRTKTRHRGYKTPWQEPKVLVIYVVDARGRPEQTFRPAYDATMGDCDAVFSMLVAYLQALGAHEAAQLIKEANSHVCYFDRNAARMQYRQFRTEGIPCGSGAVESAVRCIVNLRLKSPGKFWLQANAEGMLLLRSYLNAGRFDDLFEWFLRAAVPWWVDDVLNPLTAPGDKDQTRSAPCAASEPTGAFSVD